MYKKNVIHIGYPKTGTTWFQNVLFPQVKNKNYLSRGYIEKILTEENAFVFNAKKIKSTLQELHPYIISHEGLCGNMHNFGLNGFLTLAYAKRLREIVEDAFIVIFIRNQYEIILSTYLQYIRNGGTYGLKEYLYHNSFKRNKNAYLFSFEYFKYDRVIRLYKNLFGDENVKILLYEDFFYKKRIFLNSFIFELGLDIDLDQIDINKVNKSYGKWTYLLARFFNLFTKEGMIFKYYLFNIPRWYDTSKNFLDWLNKKINGPDIYVETVFGEKEMVFLNQYFKKSNRTLIEKYNLINIEKYDYPL